MAGVAKVENSRIVKIKRKIKYLLYLTIVSHCNSDMHCANDRKGTYHQQVALHVDQRSGQRSRKLFLSKLS